ncbi:PREDICTED: zinc finger protein 467 isoform X2 [Bison bison bison]|uniref:Zinc finger protein 467 isoform X2 n=1 Tax=Bison bison bison TaxID=43346 RepID=A0A6P3HSJ7_BISBB|nr:PREDICTED: zinc finger protein 467 isoform X2 [Bison bison bison]
MPRSGCLLPRNRECWVHAQGGPLSISGVCSILEVACSLPGREAPRPEKGARTEQAETPCREDQVCAPRKPEPTGSCPGDEWMIRKVKVEEEEEDREAHKEAEWPPTSGITPQPLSPA